MKPALKFLLTIAAVAGIAGLAQGQMDMKKEKKAPLSPPAETSVTVNGKSLTIKYSAPSLRGREVFAPGGQVSKDPTYPVWRAGANAATSLHTDADLDIGGVAVPKGDYTLFVSLEDPAAWQLIVNKQTGQWGLTYTKAQDLGRVKMTMSKPPAPIETYKMTLSAGKLQLEWGNVVASVPITVK
jgi:Protein of unknown function (DUF2911)